jgi:structural maintenance of chromosome 2
VSLVHLAPEDFNKSTALEVTAGGKLYNVVIENEIVRKDLQHSKLKKHVAIIPLNKINSSKMPAQVCIACLLGIAMLTMYDFGRNFKT